jgi:precorrin-2 methylase
MKKGIWVLAAVVMFSGASLFGASFTIGGSVKQPLNLSTESLAGFRAVRVQQNEILRDGSYRGSWHFDGVPLRTLLETALVEKEESGFAKGIDLAVVVRDREGREVAFSWGEIFYRNSADVIIATSAVPIRPRHKSDATLRYAEQFDRKIGFPKLVAGADDYADRSIENVVSIEVVNLRPGVGSKKMEKPFAPSLSVTGAGARGAVIDTLAGLPRRELRSAHMGEGSGFNGFHEYAGAPLRAVLEKAGVASRLSDVFLFSAPDGYRTALSHGEIFLQPSGRDLLIADTEDGKLLDWGGKFAFIPAGDLLSDRDVKALEKIEAIDLRRKPHLSLIGIGSGDTDLVTVEALTAIARADLLVCTPDIRKRFAKYLGDKPVLLDFYEFLPPKLARKHADLAGEKLLEKMQETWRGIADTIRAEIARGKTVALLDYGDPTVWGATEYLRETLDPGEYEIVPGLSSFNVASALLERHTGCRGAMVLADGKGVLENESLFREAAHSGATLSVFLGRKDLARLAEFLGTAYPADAPAAVVFEAGYSGLEKVVRTDVRGFRGAIEEEKEKDLFLLFLGPCLEAGTKPHRH